MMYLREIKCSVAVSKLLKIAILIRTKQTHLHVIDSVYRLPLKIANYSYYMLVRVTANILKFYN